jgi:hypothetical protein
MGSIPEEAFNYVQKYGMAEVSAHALIAAA